MTLGNSLFPFGDSTSISERRVWNSRDSPGITGRGNGQDPSVKEEEAGLES